MDCMHYRRCVADRLDDLLEGEATRAFDAHVTSCAACAVALEEGKRLRALLYAPFAVPEPPGDLAERVLAHSRPPRPAAGRFLRYVASFAAGVVVTMAATSLRSDPPRAQPETGLAEPLLSQEESDETDTYRFPRRIR